MERTVEAVYEHGVLRPLEPLSLVESQHVKLTISDASTGRSYRDMALVESAEQEIATFRTIPTIEDVRAALTSIPGSLADDVIADRGDY